MEQDALFMAEAIRLSELAVKHGNEPFGAILVKDGEIVYTNENQIYTGSDPTFHAEMGLLRRFCAETGVTDLSDYTLYSSCEPCFMCSGAMVWVKLGRLVYAANDTDLGVLAGESGCDCSAMVFRHSPNRPNVTAGVLREESLAVLRAYFSSHQKG
nr:nucleoside deaminase [uncultured Oscillibacter sp.]